LRLNLYKMSFIADQLLEVKKHLPPHVTLVAISKTKPNQDILEAYQAGQRVFGENKVQELVEKFETLPKDIEWHLVGHLQTNKVKYIAPFVGLIHSVDSKKLLEEINKQGNRINRKIPILLQIYIAKEETKFGLDESELHEICTLINQFTHIEFKGLMGMATNTNDSSIVRNEFKFLKDIFDQVKKKYYTDNNSFKEISMGMSSDYLIAIEEGSTMVRVGSNIFGQRNTL
jgi:PLP dependent protein